MLTQRFADLARVYVDPHSYPGSRRSGSKHKVCLIAGVHVLASPGIASAKWPPGSYLKFQRGIGMLIAYLVTP